MILTHVSLCCRQCEVLRQTGALGLHTLNVCSGLPGPRTKWVEGESCGSRQSGDAFGSGHTRPHTDTRCAPGVTTATQAFLELPSPSGHWVPGHLTVTVLSTLSATTAPTPIA